MNKFPRAFLLATVDFETGVITGYGIYSEQSPTTMGDYTFHTVQTFNGESYQEALNDALGTLRQGAKSGGAYGIYWKRILKDVEYHCGGFREG